MVTAEKRSFSGFINVHKKETLLQCHSTASLKPHCGAASCRPHRLPSSDNSPEQPYFTGGNRPDSMPQCSPFSNNSHLKQTGTWNHKILFFHKVILPDSLFLSAASFWNYVQWATPCASPEVNLPQKLLVISILFSHKCALSSDF